MSSISANFESGESIDEGVVFSVGEVQVRYK